MEPKNSELKMPLTMLRAGETGIIVSVSSNPGEKGWKHGGGYRCARRLMDMGLTPGTKIEVSKSAPFHGPIEVIVRGSRLALGRGMAERIIVEKTG